MNKFIVFSALVAMAIAAGPHEDAGPTTAYNDWTGQDCREENEMFVDKRNMCWYHQCVKGGYGGMTLIPRRCALGSRVSYNFIAGFSNPCTVNFDSVYGYECMRHKESVDGAPECFADLVCENGGTRTFEADKCWCICPETWQGDFDCSKPTRDVTYIEPGSDICVNGNPMDDWCRLTNGCLNGGDCYNQCDTFWCDCPEHKKYNYKGKRCEDM